MVFKMRDIELKPSVRTEKEVKIWYLFTFGFGKIKKPENHQVLVGDVRKRKPSEPV